MARLLVAYGKMVPLARVSVTFTGGTPSIAHVASVRGDLLNSDITVADNAVGDTMVLWTAGKLPSQSGQPTVTLNAGDMTARTADAVNVTNGVRVRTSAGGAGEDVPFTVCIY